MVIDSTHELKALVLHPNPSDIKEELFYLLDTYQLTCELVKTMDDAQSLLKEIGYKTFHFVISYHDLESFDSFDLFKHLVDNKSTSYFVSLAPNVAKNWLPYKKHKIYGSFDIKNKSNLESFFKHCLKDTDDSVEAVPVNATFLELYETYPADIFIRLTSGRLVKVFKKGDPREEEDIKKYIARNVNTFFLEKDAHSYVLLPPDKLPKKETAISDIKEGPFALDDEFLTDLAEKQKEIVQRLKNNKNFIPFLKKLNINRQESVFIKTRISLISNIICSLAQQLEWGNDATYKKLIYVSHVHDFPLFDNTKLAKIQFPEEIIKYQLSEEERKLVHNHPQIVKEFIDEDPYAPPDADVIVLQHHELPEQMGFPNKISISRITPISALLCVSVNFAQYIIDNKNWAIAEYLKLAKKKFKGGFYGKILQALEDLANNKVKG